MHAEESHKDCPYTDPFDDVKFIEPVDGERKRAGYPAFALARMRSTACCVSG